MRLELYDEVALLFHSEEKDIYFVQHMIKNIFCIKKIIRNRQDLQVYELLKNHPHPNMANVIDFAYSHDKTIIIEEFINGCTLDFRISQRPLYPKEVENIMLQLFSVVSHIHKLHPTVIHRDIKPENILIYQGHITLIDFEISKRYLPNCVDIMKCGSVGYAAPEQYDGRSNQQSDIYAVGILLREIVYASEQTEPMLSILHDIIHTSTQMDETKRYQSVNQMKKEFLQRFHHRKW